MAILKTLGTILMNFLRGRSLANHNRQIGSRFQEENAARPGVTKTASGLQYEILQLGDGPKPEHPNKVLVHYQGTLVNGVVFDSSYARGEPLTLELFGIIAGWREGLRLMPQGSRFRFVVPPELAYGQSKAGMLIGPWSTLVFEIELLEVIKK